MGDRAQVHIKDTGVYLYTHWGGYNLPETVHRALSKRWRWDDPEYLARIIFEEMIKPFPNEETGFGIDTEKHDDAYRIVTIDCSKEKISITDFGKTIYESTFEGFVSNPVGL